MTHDESTQRLVDLINSLPLLGGVEPAKGPVVVWLKPTTVSPACKYTGTSRPTVGRKMLSDCGVWMTPYAHEMLVPEPGKDLCPLCAVGKKCAGAKTPVFSKLKPGTQLKRMKR